MPDLNNEERRPRAEAAFDKSGGRPGSDSPTTGWNLALATPAECAVFWLGYSSGYTAGVDAGYRQCDEELATLQREAVRVVRSLAGLPERDRAADRARRARIDARYQRPGRVR